MGCIWSTHEIAYQREGDRVLYAKLIHEMPYLANCVSYSTFRQHKPYWLRPAKWLTCECPSCYELKCMHKTYARVVPVWHEQDAKAKLFVNPRPSNAPTDSPETTETYCWTCRLHNSLYSVGDVSELFKIAVCQHAHTFSAESSAACAHGMYID